MTIRETLAEGKELLRAPSLSSSIDTPDLDAALLLSEILHKSRSDLITRGNESISEQDREKFFCLISRRRNGECVAYILGRKEFRGLDFVVNPHVLIPRPDTETLVEAALECSDQKHGILSLLDLCTGSGAVAVSLKNERPFLRVSASDISPEALETARRNAARLLHGSDEVRFIRSDLFENISGRFDIITANPPYIPTGELSGLAPEVRGEPMLALDGGVDGLELTGLIISQAPEHILPGGAILLEAAPEQMPAIRSLLETNGFGGIRIRRDLAGRDRVIAAMHT